MGDAEKDNGELSPKLRLAKLEREFDEFTKEARSLGLIGFDDWRRGLEQVLKMHTGMLGELNSKIEMLVGALMKKPKEESWKPKRRPAKKAK